jgi:chemotaxis protein CheD
MPAVQPIPAPGPQRQGVYLYPGELFASAEPTVVTTILGTCVAACLFDPRSGVGGINHFLLPVAPPGELSTRFGDVATRELIEKLQRLGAEPRRLQAKVFGGMNGRGSWPRDLGTRNLDAALEQLDRFGVMVMARDVGGPRGRKLLFQTDDGQAWVRQL